MPFFLRTILVFLLITTGEALCQEFNYAHFDTRDGLAGSTVYDMCQDQDGFLWFATENGLSRYDGTSFVNFTVKEGLPDNEALFVYNDKAGRVWIGTFSKEVCFYYQGKIHNRKNTPMLANFSLKNTLSSMVEMDDGTILFGDASLLYALYPDQKVVLLSETPVFRAHRFGGLYLTKDHFTDRVIISSLDTVFSYKDNNLHFEVTRTARAVEDSIRTGVKNSQYIPINPPGSLLRLTAYRRKVRYLATVSGALSVDSVTGKVEHTYLKGKVVSKVLKDVEQNTWFTTMGNGVYKLASTETRNIRFQLLKKDENTEVYSLMWHNNLLYGGLASSEVALLDEQLKEKQRLNLELATRKAFNNVSINRLFCSLSFNKDIAFLGFDAYLVKQTPDQQLSYAPITAIKSITRIDDAHILVGCAFGAYKMRVSDMMITDTIWSSRITKAACIDGVYYIGTTHGLYMKEEGRPPLDLAAVHPALGRRITGIVGWRGTTWIITGDNGVLGLRDGKVVAVLDERSGLSSNICRTIFATDSAIWVGTNRGLNRITVQQGAYSILKIGSLDGLPSDNISSILVRGDMVYLGTPEGLSFFNVSKIISHSICNLRLLKVQTADTGSYSGNAYVLPYRRNSIRFEYTAVSARSAGQIMYYYRLKGLEDKWRSTREQFVDFPILPPGDYQFELYAVNRFGVRSSTMSIPVQVLTPFWQRWWFFLIAGLAVAAVTGMILHLRNKSKTEKMEEKMLSEKRLAELEQLALQAQMNPHFIFNCLNSIQQYFLSNDGEKANKFLSMFATLVRETLHFSGQKTVRISDEVRYLKRYLEMEQMRFGDQFDYKIEIASDVQPDYAELPALLLQPYVENAIRHGIRHKLNGKGHILISFSQAEGRLQCIVRDNGVGRRQTMAMKSRQAIEYQSKGMELGQKRIEALNRLHDEQITIDVIDLYTSSGEPEGTEVKINIPV